MSHYEQDDEQVFTRGPGPRGSDGAGSRERRILIGLAGAIALATALTVAQELDRRQAELKRRKHAADIGAAVE